MKILILLFISSFCYGQAYIGTIKYQTINDAAQVATSGQTVTVKPGLYRETIVPKNSGVTFVGETGAIISGLEKVTGTWSNHSANISKISNPETVQIFENGEMLFEARWPNIVTVDELFDREKLRKIPYSTATSINDVTIPANVTGAKIWLNGWYITITGKVTSQSGSNITFTPSQSDPKKRKYYYLVGTLSLLDAPKEWFWENGTLYVYGNPQNIEYKARTIGFDLRGKSSTTVKGFEFIGCDPVVGDLLSENTVVDGIKARYTNHVFNVTPISESGVSGSMAISYYNARRTGIKLIGPNSEIKNSEIDVVSSQAVWLGQNGKAINNKFTRINYEGNYGCPVMIWEKTDGQVISYNTSKVTGRSAVDFGYVLNDKKENIDISYNDFSEYGALNIDVGAFYSGGFKITTGTRIHHNWIHDTKAEVGDGVNCAIYYDMGSGPSNCDHNVLWNNSNDFYVNSNFEHRQGVVGNIYNNTAATKRPSNEYVQSYKSPTTPDIHRNGIYLDEIMLRLSLTTADVKNSITMKTDPQFVGVGEGGLKFQLKPTSPAIDAGIVIPGVTTGDKPDAGAYEHGVKPWGIPGYVPAVIVPPIDSIPPVDSIKFISQDTIITFKGIYPSALLAAKETVQEVTITFKDVTPKPEPVQIEAEAFTDRYGVTTTPYGIGGTKAGSWIKYSVPFGKQIKVTMRYTRGNAGDGIIEVRIGSTTGQIISTITATSTGSWNTFGETSTVLLPQTGTQDIFITFPSGNGIANIDYFKFE